MRWVDIEGMRHEMLDAYPGISALKYGLICIGEDVEGGGNPFFIPTNAGENPPVYQIDHALPESSFTQQELASAMVCTSLSTMFEISAVGDLTWYDGPESYDVENL